jgi:hypothetical protein
MLNIETSTFWTHRWLRKVSANKIKIFFVDTFLSHLWVQNVEVSIFSIFIPYLRDPQEWNFEFVKNKICYTAAIYTRKMKLGNETLLLSILIHRFSYEHTFIQMFLECSVDRVSFFFISIIIPSPPTTHYYYFWLKITLLACLWRKSLKYHNNKKKRFLFH